eukprot:7356335-Pyramimonas_sp.AAC.1
MGQPPLGTAVRLPPQAPGRRGHDASATSSRCRSYRPLLRAGWSQAVVALLVGAAFALIMMI